MDCLKGITEQIENLPTAALMCFCLAAVYVVTFVAWSPLGAFIVTLPLALAHLFFLIRLNLKLHIIVTGFLLSFTMWSVIVDLYTVKCESKWRTQALDSQDPNISNAAFAQIINDIQKHNNSAAYAESLDVRTPMESDNANSETVITNEMLSTYCNDETTQQGSWPTVNIVPISSAEDLGDIGKIFMRPVPCFPLTCTFFMKSLYKKLMWVMYMCVVIASCIMFLTGFCRKILPACCYNSWRKCFRWSRYQAWLGWYFIWFLPGWVLIYRAFAGDFDYEGIMVMIFSAVDTLTSDTQRLVIVIVLVVAIFVAYIKRERIYEVLEIDRKYLHITESLKDDTIRVCIWRVDPLRHWTDEDPQAAQARTFQSMFTTTAASKAAPVANTKLEGTKKGKYQKGEPAEMYVRIGYGHNEPMQSQVQFVPAIRDSPVFFGQTFSVQKQEVFDWEGGQSPFFIEVRDQSVLGSKELRRTRWELEELEERIEKSEAKRKKDVSWAKVQQFSLSKNSSKEEEERADQFGFIQIPLAPTGVIFLALAEDEPAQGSCAIL